MAGLQNGFVTGGTWCVDYNITVPSWPREESATRIQSTLRRGGGSACNFAVDMRILAPDVPVATISLRGADADGDFLADVCREHGIDAHRFHVDPGLTTHRTMAFTARDNGKRTHVFEAESSDHLTPDHFDFTGLAPGLFHLGLPGTHKILDAPWDGDPNGWVTVLKKARAAGFQTNMEVMTISPEAIRQTVTPCLEHLDYLVVNDYEIGALSKVDTLSEDGRTRIKAVIEAARLVLVQGRMKLVVVHFPEGAVAIRDTGELTTQPSVNVRPDTIVGTNGAGDAFAAGFFCGLHKELSLAASLRLAHASATASLRSVDTYGAMVTMQECLKLAEKSGWNPPIET